MTALIVAERMTRATRLQSLKKKTFTGRVTMMDKTVKRKDFDFLGLRKEGAQYTNKNAILVTNALKTYENPKVIFSEIIQKFNTKLKTKDYVVVISSERIYLFGTNYILIEHRMIDQLTEIIMTKSNPCILALCFSRQSPLLLQTYRRPELAVYLIT
jgi:hypothetical protein